LFIGLLVHYYYYVYHLPCSRLGSDHNNLNNALIDCPGAISIEDFEHVQQVHAQQDSVDLYIRAGLQTPKMVCRILKMVSERARGRDVAVAQGTPLISI
jgi:hypothetical protein